MDRPAGQQASGLAGSLLLWILAALSTMLLAYEAVTLVNSVWRPLIANPQALQTDFHYYNDAALRFSANRSRLYLATDDVIAGFAYPPPAIVPFIWLSKFPLGTSLLALTIASYLVLLAALQHWIRFLRRNGVTIDRATNAMLLLIAVALAPTYMNAIFGQVNAFVLASGIVFVTMSATAPLEAGSVLAAGIWLKVYPVLLAAMMIWEKRAWRALLCAAGALIAIVIVLLPIVPLDSYAVFFLQVLPARADKTAIHMTNQSLVAFLERFRYPSSQFLNWTGEQAVTVGGLVRAINWIFAAAAIAWMTLRAAKTSLAPWRGARHRLTLRRGVDCADGGRGATRLGTHLRAGVTAGGLAPGRHARCAHREGRRRFLVHRRVNDSCGTTFAIRPNARLAPECRVLPILARDHHVDGLDAGIREAYLEGTGGGHARSTGPRMRVIGTQLQSV